jgi:hypothetical protein
LQRHPRRLPSAGLRDRRTELPHDLAGSEVLDEFLAADIVVIGVAM